MKAKDVDKIFVVTHKKIEKLIQKKNYSYIQVNRHKNEDLGFIFNDNNGKNISQKNNNYCELTALYWIWKNYKCEDDNIIGLCHYRRFFTLNKNCKFLILNMPQIKRYLKSYDMILPQKFYFPVTTYNNYFEYGSGKEKDLKVLRKTIKKLYPDYLTAYDDFLEQKEGHYCNMMICRKKMLDDYCEWLFHILFELEKNIDLSDYTPSEARIYGYLSELLLNVYVIKNNLRVKEVPVINTEISFITKIKNKFFTLIKGEN